VEPKPAIIFAIQEGDLPGTLRAVVAVRLLSSDAGLGRNIAFYSLLAASTFSENTRIYITTPLV